MKVGDYVRVVSVRSIQAEYLTVGDVYRVNLVVSSGPYCGAYELNDKGPYVTPCVHVEPWYNPEDPT